MTNKFGHDLIPHRPVEVLFSIARGSAIDWYARYEQSLLRLFATLLGAELGYANIIFFRMNNARARLSIIEKFLKKRHGDEFNFFWNSAQTKLSMLDDKRNHIVHWAQAVYMNETGVYKVNLIPPHYWDNLENLPQVTIDEIYVFIEQCNFYMPLITKFEQFISREKNVFFDSQDELQTWQGIFRQPITYPPPNNHPLYRKPTAP